MWLSCAARSQGALLTFRVHGHTVIAACQASPASKKNPGKQLTLQISDAELKVQNRVQLLLIWQPGDTIIQRAGDYMVVIQICYQSQRSKLPEPLDITKYMYMYQNMSLKLFAKCSYHLMYACTYSVADNVRVVVELRHLYSAVQFSTYFTHV